MTKRVGYTLYIWDEHQQKHTIMWPDFRQACPPPDEVVTRQGEVKREAQIEQFDLACHHGVDDEG